MLEQNPPHSLPAQVCRIGHIFRAQNHGQEGLRLPHLPFTAWCNRGISTNSCLISSAVLEEGPGRCGCAALFGYGQDDVAPCWLSLRVRGVHQTGQQCWSCKRSWYSESLLAIRKDHLVLPVAMPCSIKGGNEARLVQLQSRCQHRRLIQLTYISGYASSVICSLSSILGRC